MKPIISANKGIAAILLLIMSLSVFGQITGYVDYHDDPTNTLPDVIVELYNDNGDLVASTTTNSQGQFYFSGISPGEYSLTAWADLTTGTVNLIDASLILQYLQGTYTFTDYEFAAADVNGSGNVTFGDYMLVMISYLMQGNPFPGDEWLFEEATVIVSPARDSTEDIRMWGTSKGDVEGIWQPGGRDLDGLNTSYDNIIAVEENEMTVVIGSNYERNIAGYDLDLVFPVSKIEITEIQGPDDNFHYDIDRNTGELRVIWLDENENPGQKYSGSNLFTVTIRSAGDIEEGDALFHLLDGGMILNSKYDPVDNITIEIPRVVSAEISTPDILEVSSYPNPVRDLLNLRISSPYETNASISIHDIRGATIKTITYDVYKGNQLVEIELSNLVPGQYIYRIHLSGESLVGRFVK